MDMNQFQDLIRNIKALVRCPRCLHAYENEGISIVNEIDGAYIVYLECYYCGASGLATVVAKEVHYNDQPAIKKSLKSPLANPSKITADDLIDFHNFLDNFNGDFKSYIK